MKSWLSASRFIRGAAIDLYFKHRGIDVTDDEAASLRFAPSLWHWPSKSRWPAMLARVAMAPLNGADGASLTTHQTFLEPDGSGKAPLGDKERLFAAGGKTTGGGVWFGKADPEREFIVCEGIESTLSAMRIFNAKAGCAALSALGIARLVLPPEARLVRAFCDHDELQQSLSAAHEASRRWRAEGRVVNATMSPIVGCDANDVLQMRLKGQ
jgi:putative DNA primase/helicase